MNKYKKLAIAAVSMVMAGTMAVSLAACGGGGGSEGPSKHTPRPATYQGTIDNTKITKLLTHMTESKADTRETRLAEGWKTAQDYWTILKNSDIEDAGAYDYAACTSRANVELNIAIGHNDKRTSTHFASDFGKTITLPDGNTYTNSQAKPAWAQMGKDLNITWKDVYKGWSSSANLNNIVSNQDGATYGGVDMFTTDLSVAVSKASSGTNILNLADHLDEMPHFKAFLESNPIVYLSLLQDGMDKTTGEGKTLYVAPYFDGYDDIERYCLMRQDMVAKLLNGNTASTSDIAFTDACAEDVYVSSYMGQTGKINIESLNEAGTAKITITKDYDAALAAAKDESTALGKAYKAITDAVYAGTSGNIVDIMNEALKVTNGATGAQLLDLYRAYIDVAYKNGTSAAYAADKRANLFNGYDAAWDADDLCALLRCAMTNSSMLVGEGKTLQGIAPRSGQNDRTPDMVSLAAQLFGARGATSRFEQTYIDSEGKLQDARNDAHYWEAMALLHNFKAEGLIADYTGYGDFSAAQGINGDVETLMLYDYSQTQTSNAIALDADVSIDLPQGYKFGPVMTPVAKWDVDGDNNYGEADEIFRFTESWRSTKTGGLALNGALTGDKLTAALQFVDYLYSEDGQIVSTYGPMATNAQGAGGFWYNTQATAEQIAAGKYFTYKGVKYSGTDYKGKTTPTITTTLYNAFAGKDGVTGGGSANLEGSARNFTNYARRLIGSTLPVGVKDQSFENQLTASMGREGANKVGQGLALGTVKGMSLEIDANNYWFTCVPSGLPISSDIQSSELDGTAQQHLKYITGTAKKSGDKNFYSIMNYIILNGLSGRYNQQSESYSF